MIIAGPADCRCLTPPFDYRDFESQDVGVDETKGRFGAVSIETCKLCGRKWLRYLVEYEAFSKSGRWFRGAVPVDTAHTVTPETAIAVLEGLAWYFVGGSYFDSTGFRRAGPVGGDL